MRTGKRALLVASCNIHGEDEADFAHVRHGGAVHEGLLQPLDYSMVASTDENIVDIQRENGETQGSDDVAVKPIPSSATSMVSYHRAGDWDRPQTVL